MQMTRRILRYTVDWFWDLSSAENEEQNLAERTLRLVLVGCFLIAALNLLATPFIYGEGSEPFAIAGTVLMIVVIVCIWTIRRGYLKAVKYTYLVLLNLFLLGSMYTVNYPNGHVIALIAVVIAISISVLFKRKSTIFYFFGIFLVAIGWRAETQYDGNPLYDTPSQLVSDYLLIFGLYIGVLYIWQIYRQRSYEKQVETRKQALISERNAVRATTDLDLLLFNLQLEVRARVHDIGPDITKLILKLMGASITNEEIIARLEELQSTMNDFQIMLKNLDPVIRPKIQVVNLGGMLDSALALVSNRDDKPIEVELNIMIDGQPLQEDNQIGFSTDPDLLSRVLNNVLANAWKHTESGTIKVVVECPLDLSFACIRIIDSGKGIALDQLERIFVAYYQVDNNDKNNHGIGLATTRRMLAALDSLIHAESNGLGHGSTFVIKLTNKKPT